MLIACGILFIVCCKKDPPKNQSSTPSNPHATTNPHWDSAHKYCYTCWQNDVYNNYVLIESTKISMCDSPTYFKYSKSVYPLVYYCRKD